MARSIQYWYDYMAAEKNTLPSLNVLQPNIDNHQTLLTDVTSTSKVARWRLMLWVVAACAYAVDVVFDLTILNLEKLAQNSRFGTLPWYVNQSLTYQHGDALVFQNNEFQYPVLDLTKRIIERAAAQENGNTVNVKVAKLVANVPTKLDVAQKAAFTAYIAKIKPAGIKVNVISDDPDELKLFLKINFDPLLLSNTGELLTTSGVFPVNNAVNDYLKNLNFNFNGTLELCDLIDKIQAATGVKSAYVISASARFGANPFVLFTERYQANAGHMIIDSTSPLTATVTYQPIN